MSEKILSIVYFNFLIGEISNALSGKDTTKESTMLENKILHPAGAPDATVEKALQQKFLPWRGDDNKLYKLSLEQKQIKAVPRLIPSLQKKKTDDPPPLDANWGGICLATRDAKKPSEFKYARPLKPEGHFFIFLVFRN